MRVVAKKMFGEFKICYDVYMGEIKYVLYMVTKIAYISIFDLAGVYFFLKI